MLFLDNYGTIQTMFHSCQDNAVFRGLSPQLCRCDRRGFKGNGKKEPWEWAPMRVSVEVFKHYESYSSFYIHRCNLVFYDRDRGDTQ